MKNLTERKCQKKKTGVKRQNQKKRIQVRKEKNEKIWIKKKWKEIALFNQLNEIQCIFNFFLFLLIQADSFQSLTDQWKYDIDLSNN